MLSELDVQGSLKLPFTSKDYQRVGAQGAASIWSSEKSDSSVLGENPV